MEPIYGILLLLLLATAGGLAFWTLRQSRQIAPLRRRASRLNELAGFGQAILGAQLQLEALCEIVYQQASQIIDTTNFQLGLFDEFDYIIMIWLRDGERLPSQRFPRAASDGLIGWVRSSGQEILVGDFEAEWEHLPAKPSYQSSSPSRSALFAPLVAGGTVIGVIAVQSPTPHLYVADDLQLLKVLTNQAAGAIRNAQLFEQAQARNRQLQLVSDVSQQVTAVQPLSDLFHQIVTLVRHTFGYYAVSIFTLDEKEDFLRLRASTHKNYAERILRFSVGEGLIGWAAEHAQTALVSDVTRDSRYLDDGLLVETHSEVTVPLIVERRVVGVLDVQSDVIGAFTQDDVVVLETLASQIALAIQEAETYAAERRQRERLNALTEASRAVVSILNIDDLLDEVVDLLTDYFEFDRTHIFLREGNRVIFRAGSGTHSARWYIEQLSYDLDDKGIIAKSVRTGQPIICGDVANYEDYIPGSGVEDTQSEMVIPIRMGRHTLGALDIQSTELDAFSSDDAALAEALSDTMAIALRNATLYAREKRRRILAESLREVSMVLGASLEVDHVIDGILHGLERVVNVDAAIIALYDDEDAAYRVSALRGDIEDRLSVGDVIPVSEDIEASFEQLFHAGQQPSSIPQHEPLTIPLTLGEDPIGYLSLDYHAGYYSADDLEIINAFATQSAMAIANAHLYMAQREEAWVSTALLQVAESTARADTLDEVLQTVARITPLLVGVEWCAVMLSEDAGYRIVEVEGAGSELEHSLVGSTVEPEDWPLLSEMLEKGMPVYLDPQNATFPAFAGTMEPLQIEQGVMLPLYTKGEIVGALLIGQQNRVDTLSTRKIELVGGIANQAALAIESAQLHAAQQEEAWVTTALLQVAQAVNAQVEMKSSLETVVRLTPLLVGVQHCSVLPWDENRRCFRSAVSYGLAPEQEDAISQISINPENEPYFAELSRSSPPLAAGIGAEYAIPNSLSGVITTPAILGLPLTAQGMLVGVMLVDHPNAGQDVDRRRMNILTGIASQTALAIETSRLQAVAAERQRMERELEVAKNIQSSFLPDRTPSVEGWDVAAYYRAAHMVGGDFYDFLPLPDGKWGLVVADVADKGMPAALYMALSRTLLRAVARNRSNPAETLLRVNKLLLEDTHSDLFVTMWYGIWDPAEGTIFFSSAGHNPPFILSGAQHATSTLKLKGIALGVLSDITLQTSVVHLQPGDTLVLYTDGITEAQDDRGRQFEVAGLERATRSTQPGGAQDTLNGIIGALDSHTGSEPQFDDLTLVIVQCHASDHTAGLPRAAR